MEIIVNNKTFEHGLNIIQLETAVGAAMKSFEGSIGMRQPTFLYVLHKLSYFFNEMPNYYLNLIRYDYNYTCKSVNRYKCSTQ